MLQFTAGREGLQTTVPLMFSVFSTDIYTSQPSLRLVPLEKWEELLLCQKGKKPLNCSHILGENQRIESVIGELVVLQSSSQLNDTAVQLAAGESAKRETWGEGAERKEGPLRCCFEHQSAQCGTAAKPLK